MTGIGEVLWVRAAELHNPHGRCSVDMPCSDECVIENRAVWSTLESVGDYERRIAPFWY